ncbi:MAG: hypothetical protein KGL39_32510 [Patescibacteria group bacterium]|nr:hypothetical protein [Patescibacteria group bacterium]
MAKKKTEQAQDQKQEEAPKPEPKKELSRDEQLIHESRKILLNPVPAGMRIFEAPNGYCMLGEAKKQEVLCRHFSKKGDSGIWIKPRREPSK